MLQDSWRWQAAVFESYLASVPSVSMLAGAHCGTLGQCEHDCLCLQIFTATIQFRLQPTTRVSPLFSHSTFQFQFDHLIPTTKLYNN